MPVGALKSFAAKSGKSLSVLERYWDECKANIDPEHSSKGYGAVMNCVKRRAGLSSGKGNPGRSLMSKAGK